MAKITVRNADIVVPWDDNIDLALQVALGNAVMNSKIHQYVPRGKSRGIPQVSVTIDGDQSYEWDVVRVIVGLRGIEELLLARMANSERHSNVGTDYVLVVRTWGGDGFGGYAVPAVARIDREPDRFNDHSYADDKWLDDWDEVLVRLREEAIMRQITR